jgi:replicative DNA helicase
MACAPMIAATPLETQAKKLYAALKANKSTERVYKYCKKHNISPDDIAFEIEIICNTKNDQETLAAADALIIEWKLRRILVEVAINILEQNAKTVNTLQTVEDELHEEYYKVQAKHHPSRWVRMKTKIRNFFKRS